MADSESVILIVGAHGAGKSTAASHLAMSGSLVHLEASDFLRARYEVSRTGMTLLDFVDRLFEAEGRNVIARDAFEALRARHADRRAVVSGFRTPEEIQVFLDAFEGTRLLSVSAPASLRYRRVLIRDRLTQADMSLDKFNERDHREESLGLRDVLARDDASVILNDGALESFLNQVDSWYRFEVGRARR